MVGEFPTLMFQPPCDCMEAVFMVNISQKVRSIDNKYVILLFEHEEDWKWKRCSLQIKRKPPSWSSCRV